MRLPSHVPTVMHMDVPVMKKKMPVWDMTPDTDVRLFKKDLTSESKKVYL